MSAQSAELAQAKTVKVRGTVMDVESGKPVVAASVYLKGTRWGGLTNTRGEFSFTVLEPGSYTLTVTLVGYSQLEQPLTVAAGRESTVELKLQPEVIQMEGFVVEGVAEAEKQEDQILAQRRSAVAIQDGIGSETISRTGSSNAADAVSKMTGASVVDGKYVYVRGLGERYSTTQLNGSELPSPDPYRRAVQMDLFPSNLLDRIVTVKTFTPDRPGNFSGGSVDIWTKRFPQEFTFNYSASSSYNPQVTGKSGFLTYKGGKTDWLGIDDGSRALPAAFSDPTFKMPDIGSTYSDQAKAHELDALTRSFSPIMAPTTGTGPMNYNWSMSSGDKVMLGGRELGLLGTLTYSRSASFYDKGQVGRWQLTGNVDQTDDLNNDYLLQDTRASDKVLWGGLANLSYKLDENNVIGFNLMYNHSGESIARYQYGSLPRDLTGDAVYETRSLGYTERSLNSMQLRGEHDFEPLHNLHFEWTAARNTTYQQEPDLRFFTDNYTMRERSGVVDTVYSIRKSIYPYPTRYYRDLNEDNNNLDLQFSLPFKQWEGLASRFKFGGAWNTTDRDFRERRFEYAQTSYAQYDGDPLSFYQPQYLGIVDSVNGRYRFGQYIQDASEDRGNYDGKQDIYAGFAMVELPLSKRWQLIGGARMEATRMDVISHDSTLARGRIDKDDLLPSINMIYLLRDDVNFRAAYGRTLARPNFREMAPYASFDFVGDVFFIGNQNLERTLIDNYDLRWEWFYGSGEVLAVSGFYKDFSNPIERVIKTINGEVQYQNVDRARVYGLELEGRLRLMRLNELLGRYSVGANLTFTHSAVNIAPDELEVIRSLNPYASGKRQLQGQPPYVLNLDLSYDNPERGSLASLTYNVIGERMSEVSLGGTPNVFEQPASMLDFTLTQKVWHGYSLKFGAHNLLDSRIRKVQHFKSKDYVEQEYRLGRVFSLGVNYSLK
ncbi:TonB-dependent receptor [bacterium]|nr:TonB-dependent receptor [bacterium]